MLKTILISIAALAATTGFLSPESQDSGEAGGRLEIEVDYLRQPGRGSNQYAVWIEDSEGTLVRTLYVTRFTGEGGYTRRPDCMPVWVGKAGSPSREQADAYTGATPQSGIQVYTWDGTDDYGAGMPDGKYVFCVEATYLGSNRVIFRGEFTKGGPGVSVPVRADYNSGEEQNRGMIQNVSARYIP